MTRTQRHQLRTRRAQQHNERIASIRVADQAALDANNGKRTLKIYEHADSRKDHAKLSGIPQGMIDIMNRHNGNHYRISDDGHVEFFYENAARTIRLTAECHYVNSIDVTYHN